MSQKNDPPPNISGIPQLDAYLATRLTPEEQEQMAQTYRDGDPEGSQAIINKANIRNEKE